ncbi:hypothetical protein BGX26_003527 [Mortierella sp. AD094]|nr:hypothetical protein BGX26_003527 [Mortierella sp. AD094]
MTHSPHTQTPSPATSANKSLSHTSPSPAPSLSSASVVRSASKDLDRDLASPHGPLNHQRAYSNSDHQQQPPSPPFDRRSPSSTATTQQSFTEPRQRVDKPISYYGASAQGQGAWRQQHPQPRDNHPDSRERPYHDAPHYLGSSSSSWPRDSSPSASQAPYNHLSFTRNGSALRPRSPQPYTPYPPPSDISQQRPYSGAAYQGMPPSPTARTYSPESNQAKRHRIDSDSEGFSESESRYRHRLANDLNAHPSQHEQEHYRSASYQYVDPNNGKPRHHPYAEHTRDYHPNSAAYLPSAPSDGLPQLAPRPPPLRYTIEEDLGPSGTQHQQQQQQQLQQQHQYSGHHAQVKKESGGAEPVKIQSARGTPKGPLPIDVQISLLSSVLKHDPFNCAIRKTTQAWEMISREQGIRARTCSRRFDNIIQASIGGRDRPVGTEEQQAAKKKLLEQLFEMMNQPQALKRMQKKRRYRSEDTDRRLLLETIRLNPFAQKVGQVAKAWEDVRDALNMKVHARQCIRRVNRMVKPYQLRERMYKGNIPDEMKEANDDLVKQVILLMRSSGQGTSLDDGNSNDDDSASCLSDSEDPEDPFMDTKGQKNTQEDDELEEDEDDGMVSRSESEQRATRRCQEEGVQPGETTPRSPTAPALSPISTQPTTPSLATSAASGPSTSASSAPATPAKRGRPRNPPSTQPSSHNPSDKIRNHHSHDTDTNMKDVQQGRQAWEGEVADSKTPRPSADGGSDEMVPAESTYPGQRATSQAASLSSPPLIYSPSASHPHGPGNARHNPQTEYDHNDYRRPLKHARTNSRGGRDLPMDMSHSDRSSHAPGYRYGNHAGKGQSVDPHGRPADYAPRSREHMDGYARRGYHAAAAISEEATETMSQHSPTAQQYRDVVNELRHIQEYLAQIEDQKREDLEKQSSLMYTIEKLQQQMQQQQQQLYHLQGQLRYGYSSQQAVPPPHSPRIPHHHEQPQQSPLQGGPSGSASSSAGPPTSSRYSAHPSEHHVVAPFQKNMSGRSTERHNQDISHHASYSRSESHYPPRDRDLR